MNKIKITAILGIFCFIFSQCNQENQPSQGANFKDTTINHATNFTPKDSNTFYFRDSMGDEFVPTVFKIKKENDFLTYERVAYDLMKWYIDSVYHHKINFTQNHVALDSAGGTYYIDTSAYFDVLRERNQFSEKFFESERRKCKECDEGMQRLSKKEIQKNGIGLASLSAKGCDFLLGWEWLGGQGEQIDGLKLIQSKEQSNVAFVKLMTYYVSDDNKKYSYSFPLVKLIKEDKWRILSIHFTWQKELKN